MFTGIITALGTVGTVTPLSASQDMRAVITAPDAASIGVGASVSCSGCCLTTVATGPDWFAVDISAETLAKTTLSQWAPGCRVNLERSLRAGDELGGHIVSGHVDGVGKAMLAIPEHGSTRWRFWVPARPAPYIAVKGSIAIDGVSLTVNEVERESFGVNVIPHTAAVTTFGALKPGDLVNIEIDMLARYVARLLESRTLEPP